jgi:hypothetical protein
MTGAPSPDRFTHFAAIDWSGAKGSAHSGIAIAICELGDDAPSLVLPPNRLWSRKDALDWIISQEAPILIGMDFSFAPPFVERGAYLPGDHTPNNGKAFWEHVDALCDDLDLGATSFVEQHYRRHFYFGKADGVKSDFMHLRRCEAHYNANGGNKPSSVYDVIGAAQVSKASFAGMRLLHRISPTHPIWPFDAMPEKGPVIVEIYTSIAARAAGRPKGRSKVRDPQSLDCALSALGSDAHVPLSVYSDHATDAILAAAWMRRAASSPANWQPEALTQEIAKSEGWTFGIV